MSNLDASPLGEPTNYPKAYSRDLLVCIPRQDSRDQLEAYQPAPKGYDTWTLYELAWQDREGVPCGMIGELQVPADSPKLVESKSLKLYINSLYYRRFSNATEVQEEIAAALSFALEAQVRVHLWPLADFLISSRIDKTAWENLDVLGVVPSSSPTVCDLCGPATYEQANENQENTTRFYKTDLFRSLCPVTGQPDWATVYVGVQGRPIDPRKLAAYLYSFREHAGFHESCVEQMYADLHREIQPQQLTVAARYTRRGGIDINPYRSSASPLFELPGRTVRQ